MAESDNMLLRRFADSGDAAAFSEIVRQHAGPVYGACLRVLEDQEKASDAVQDTFLQLLRDAGRVTGSLSGWLHRVATRKAVDQIRRDLRRQRREAKYAAAKLLKTSRWADISHYVDEALEELDEPERQVLLAYFFEGRSMTDIAGREGISHQTVSRQIESAVTQLRGKLQRRGVLVAAAVLGPLLGENTVKAAPAGVLKELARMALAGGKAAASATATAAAWEATAKLVATGTLAGAKVKVLLAAAAAAAIGGALTYNYVTRSAAEPATRMRTNVSAPAAVEQDSIAQPQSTRDEEYSQKVAAEQQLTAKQGKLTSDHPAQAQPEVEPATKPAPEPSSEAPPSAEQDQPVFWWSFSPAEKAEQAEPANEQEQGQPERTPRRNRGDN